MTFLRSIDKHGGPSKGKVFMVDIFKWAPEGLFAWMINKSQRPELARLRENKIYAHEAAARLIDEKKQELEDGASRKDVLSLLGSSPFPS
jgi:hypothetical protein